MKDTNYPRRDLNSILLLAGSTETGTQRTQVRDADTALPGAGDQYNTNMRGQFSQSIGFEPPFCPRNQPI